MTTVCVTGVWWGTGHHIRQQATLKDMVVVGGDGAVAEGITINSTCTLQYFFNVTAMLKSMLIILSHCLSKYVRRTENFNTASCKTLGDQCRHMP